MRVDFQIAPEDCYSIRRHGENSDYLAQDLPYATYPSKPGVVYRAGTEVGGRRCPTVHHLHRGDFSGGPAAPARERRALVGA